MHHPHCPRDQPTPPGRAAFARPPTSPDLTPNPAAIRRRARPTVATSNGRTSIGHTSEDLHRSSRLQALHLWPSPSGWVSLASPEDLYLRPHQERSTRSSTLRNHQPRGGTLGICTCRPSSCRNAPKNRGAPEPLRPGPGCGKGLCPGPEHRIRHVWNRCVRKLLCLEPLHLVGGNHSLDHELGASIGAAGAYGAWRARSGRRECGCLGWWTASWSRLLRRCWCAWSVGSMASAASHRSGHSVWPAGLVA
jgi:hypothetical protein